MTVSVATWNLERPWKAPLGVRATRLRNQIDAIRADIWILTETATNFTVSGSNGYWSTNDAPPPRYNAIERAVAVHVRSDWETRLIAASQLSVAVEVISPISPLLIAGHLIPYRDAHDGPGWQKHLQELRAASDQWRTWSQSSRYADHKLIIAGDMNMTLHPGRGYGTDAGRALLRSVERDSAVRCVTDIDLRSLRLPGIDRDNVDHIFVDEQLTLESGPTFWSGHAGTHRMSDHNGVAVHLIRSL